MSQPFNPDAYDRARDALSDVSTENLPKFEMLADTPTKQLALTDEITERERRKGKS